MSAQEIAEHLEVGRKRNLLLTLLMAPNGWIRLLSGVVSGIFSLLVTVVVFLHLSSVLAALGAMAVMALLGGAVVASISRWKPVANSKANGFKETLGYSVLLSLLLISTIVLYVLALWSPTQPYLLIWVAVLGVWAFLFGVLFCGAMYKVNEYKGVRIGIRGN